MMNAEERREARRQRLITVGRVTYNNAVGRRSSFIELLDYEIMLSMADAEREIIEGLYPKTPQMAAWLAVRTDAAPITESMLRRASGLDDDTRD